MPLSDLKEQLANIKKVIQNTIDRGEGRVTVEDLDKIYQPHIIRLTNEIAAIEMR